MSQISEEEEKLVLIQFTDLDEANYCQQFSQKLDYINLDSKNPIIQIGNRLYNGEYVNNIGTYLFFRESTSSSSSSSTTAHVANGNQNELIDNNSKESSSSKAASYNYEGKTFKKLILTRLFVEEKENVVSS